MKEYRWPANIWIESTTTGLTLLASTSIIVCREGELTLAQVRWLMCSKITNHIMSVDRKGKIRIAWQGYQAEPVSLIGKDGYYCKWNSRSTCIATDTVDEGGIWRWNKPGYRCEDVIPVIMTVRLSWEVRHSEPTNLQELLSSFLRRKIISLIL